MERLPTILLAIAIATLAGMSVLPSPTSADAPVCGPGPHWIDNCAPGVDNLESNANVAIDIDGDCQPDQGLALAGPVIVERRPALDDSINFPGTRPVDAHLDVIDTEILSMSLTGGGATLRVGLGAAGIDPGVLPTLGAIAEDPGDNTAGQSFFEVFFEVELPGNVFLYNHQPLSLGTDIDRVAPNAVFTPPGPICLDLFDSPVAIFANDTGINLVEAIHDVGKPVGGIAELEDPGAAPLAAGEPAELSVRRGGRHRRPARRSVGRESETRDLVGAHALDRKTLHWCADKEQPYALVRCRTHRRRH